MTRVAHEHRPVRIRHLQQHGSGAPGAVKVLDTWLSPQPPDGLNGPGGWVRGTYTGRLGEEGTFELELPRGLGADGVHHLDRFRVMTDDHYAPGDEWFEIHDDPPSEQPLFVGTPIDHAAGAPGGIKLIGADALDLLKKVRETVGGTHWHHAPRDVFEHYTHAWVDVWHDTFNAGRNPGWTTYQSAAFSRNFTNDYAGHQILAPGNGHSASLTSPAVLQTDATWRVEARVRILDAMATVKLRVVRSDNGSPLANVELTPNETRVVMSQIGEGSTASRRIEKAGNLEWHHLALEARDRWVYGYLDGTLIGAINRGTRPGEHTTTAKIEIVGQMLDSQPPGGENVPKVLIDHVLVREARPFLQCTSSPYARGDYHLPGAPQPGGLVGTYYDDRDIQGVDQLRKVLAPGREPVARRASERITTGAGYNTTFQPQMLPASPWSVRWTGSIRLDLEQADIYLRAYFDGACRVWVGLTRWGEQIIDGWNETAGARGVPSGSLRFKVGQRDGWYPIIIEFASRFNRFGMHLETGPGPSGPWSVVPADQLSAQGVFEQHLRGGSHYEHLRTVAQAAAFQYRAEPRSLESGEFPAVLLPQARVGRDVDLVINDVDAQQREVKGSSADVAHALIAEGAGIAKDGAQLTVEQLDFNELQRHLIIHQDEISLADTTVPEVLTARARTLQRLRATQWQEIAARPTGGRELLPDAHALAGPAALFDWDPGDSAIRVFDDLAVRDTQHTQITSVQRTFRPEALGPPVVGWRSRPRAAAARTRSRGTGADAAREAVREQARQAATRGRTYQGSPTLTQSPPAGAGGVTQVAWPEDSSSVLRVDLVVLYKADASSYALTINDQATDVAVTQAGRYDVSSVARRDGTNPRVHAKLAGGTGAVEYQLELLVRV